jgi:hypothetical protein
MLIVEIDFFMFSTTIEISSDIISWPRENNWVVDDCG